VLGTQRPRSAGRPLLYRAARRPAAALAIAGVIVTAALGLLVAGHSRPGRADGWVDGHLDARLGRYPHLADVNNLGDPRWVVIICAAAVVACLLTRRFRGALLVAIAVPVAGGLTDHILKPLVDRTSDGALTYPSGHTAAVTTMAVAAVLVLTGPGRPPLPAALRGLLSAALLALIPCVAVGLVIAHYHYFTDTIGGAGVGLAVVLGTALGLDAAAARRGARAAPAGPDPAGPAGRGGISAAARQLPRA
jgi:membrane-associated phospholipid phosphatase